MRTGIWSAKHLLTVFSAFFGLLVSTPAADKTWNPVANFNWDYSSANWNKGEYWADKDNAIFGSTGAGTVTLGATVTATSISFTAAGYDITATPGSYGLVLDASGIVSSSVDATISAAIKGGSLKKTGSGALSLSSANGFAGGTTLSEGTIRLEIDGALGSGALTMQDDGTDPVLDLTGGLDVGNAITISDTGENKTIQLAGSGANSATLSGNITINEKATTYFDVVAGSSDELTLSGTLGGPGFINAERAGDGDAGTIVLSGNNSHGETRINSGMTVRASHANALGKAASLYDTGSTLEIGDGVTISASTILTINNNGSNNVLSMAAGAATAGFAGNIVNNDDGAGDFDINAGSGQTLTVSGVISDPAKGGIEKTGAGTVVLSGDNTCTGATTVSEGTLSLSSGTANSTIGSSATIDIADGAKLDVTGISGGFVVGSSQTLKGEGTVVGASTIQGTHSPGNSPGVEYFDTLAYDGATIVWELINNTVSGPGTNFDRIMVTNPSSVANPLTFSNATVLKLDFKAADSTSLVDWDSTFWDLYNIREWQIWGVSNTTSAPTGWDTQLALNESSSWIDKDSESFDAAKTRSALPSSATFYLFEDSGNIYLRYEALPEPAGLGLLGVVLAGLTIFTRRAAACRRLP